ncbi:MAG: zinc ribbon domain-containing protein [Planctomycetes bacterium]|nr:zinc ribbon domain-containing protein [Planctomycetota bacterium]
MPIFEYKCVKCGKVSEFLVKNGSEKELVCSHCGSEKLEKQLSVFSPGIKQGDSKRCHGCSDNTCPHSQH